MAHLEAQFIIEGRAGENDFSPTRVTVEQSPSRVVVKLSIGPAPSWDVREVYLNKQQALALAVNLETFAKCVWSPLDGPPVTRRAVRLDETEPHK